MCRAQLQHALDQFNGAILTVVNERYFLERFANEIWWGETRTVVFWFGG